MSESTSILPGLSPVAGMPVEARFDVGEMTSDAGVLLLRQVECRVGVAKRLADCLTDPRDPAKIEHPLSEMIGFRVLAIAAGYADGNDCNTLRTDPVFKMALDRRPVSDPPLCSQSRISWLENLPRRRDLYRMGEAMVDLYCDSYRQVPTRIILDIDDTFDAAHGRQELSVFNAHYDERGFQPIHLYDQTGRLVIAVLRPAIRPKGTEIRTLLKRVIGRIRAAWPRVRILLRGDSHYASPEVMDWCAAMDIDFITGLGGNPVLTRRVAGRVARAVADYRVRASSQPKDWKLRRFMEFSYAAGSWSKERRVVARIEVGPEGSDVRLIVTSRTGGTARWLYETLYCQRGTMENFIKDHKRYLASDRTSCPTAAANQFRLFLHGGAYWLMWSLQAAAPRRSPWAAVQFDTLRQHLIKLAGWVEELKTRIRIHLPMACPDQPILRCLARQIPKLIR